MLNNLYRENEVNYVSKRRLTAIGPFYSVPLTAIDWSLLVTNVHLFTWFPRKCIFWGSNFKSKINVQFQGKIQSHSPSVIHLGVHLYVYTWDY